MQRIKNDPYAECGTPGSEELENRDKEIDAELEKKEVFTNVAEVTKLSKEKDAIQTELEELYEKWEELSE